jgi:hypothetical protein
MLGDKKLFERDFVMCRMMSFFTLWRLFIMHFGIFGYPTQIVRKASESLRISKV